MCACLYVYGSVCLTLYTYMRARVRVCMCVDSYPERVALQWSHHRHEKWLLQQSEHCADQGLHARQAAKLGRGVPGERERERERGSFMTTL